MNWYYDQGGQRQGPIPEAELDRLLASGTITLSTLVWCEGMADWAPLGKARAASGAGAESVPEGWIRCTATGRYFPPYRSCGSTASRTPPRRKRASCKA